MVARTFPTPWRVQIDITPRVTSITVVCDDGEDTMVCECYEGSYEQRVNAANLIAAAPEMLAALHAAVDWGAPFKDAPSSQRPDWFNAANAALKKATGENK